MQPCQHQKQDENDHREQDNYRELTVDETLILEGPDLAFKGLYCSKTDQCRQGKVDEDNERESQYDRASPLAVDLVVEVVTAVFVLEIRNSPPDR